jgi:hypothetical protein
MIDPFPPSGFRVVDDSAEKPDRNEIFAPSLLPRVAEPQPVIGKLNLDKNGTPRFKKNEQLFEYKHLLLLRDTWWSKF